jgi:hypothetical protein
LSAREGQRVKPGHVSPDEDLAAEPEVPGRSRIVQERTRSSDQKRGQNNQEHQVDRSGDDSAVVSECFDHLDAGKTSIFWADGPLLPF